MSLVTVYIPSRDYGRFLQQAIDSVLTQTFDDWSLVLVDLEPSDDSAEIMDRYAHHPQITRLSMPAVPVGTVANGVLGLATSKFLLRLDADDILDPNALLVMVTAAQRDKDAVMVTCGYWLMDEFGSNTDHQLSTPGSYQNPVMDPPPNGACTLIRTEFLTRVGGYSEDIDAQDGFDLWSRLGTRDRVAHVNLPLFQYRRHGANLTESPSRIFRARREIKRRAARSADTWEGPVVAVIPCRRNYDFRSEMWSIEIGGLTLLDRAIQSCLASDLISHVVVTADSPAALDAASRHLDPRVALVERDPKSTIINSPLGSTLRSAVATVDPEFTGVSVVRFVQTPLVSSSTLDEALDTMVIHDLDSASGVRPLASEVYLRTPRGLIPVAAGASMVNGYSTLVRDARAVNAFRNSNLKYDDPAGLSRGYFELTPDEAMFIDSARSLELARAMMAVTGRTTSA